MGFEEISHTADWSVRVWAQDLPSLFAESARAMNSLSGTVTGKVPRVKRMFANEAPDAESLLVAFLSELVYYQEQENLAFDKFKLEVTKLALPLNFASGTIVSSAAVSKGKKLKVEMEGGPIASVDKAIKAVTYHNLKIEKTNEGFETTIVFDV